MLDYYARKAQLVAEWAMKGKLKKMGCLGTMCKGCAFIQGTSANLNAINQDEIETAMTSHDGMYICKSSSKDNPKPCRGFLYVKDYFHSIKTQKG